jgi:hypothetical protein
MSVYTQKHRSKVAVPYGSVTEQYMGACGDLFAVSSRGLEDGRREESSFCSEHASQSQGGRLPSHAEREAHHQELRKLGHGRGARKRHTLRCNHLRDTHDRAYGDFVHQSGCHRLEVMVRHTMAATIASEIVEPHCRCETPTSQPGIDTATKQRCPVIRSTFACRDRNILSSTGPPALVLQFFRHYGHPERNRFCEVIQLGIAVAFGCLFPVGLVCSVAGMPSPIQYLWVSYQIYVVGVMYIARFLNVEAWASAEELIAEKLIDGKGKGAVHLWEDHTCGKFLACNLETSFHHSYREGRSHAESLQRACD